MTSTDFSFLSTDAFTSAVNEARNWVADGCNSAHESERMIADFEAGLDEFDTHIHNDDFGPALDVLTYLSMDWASNDETPFAAFARAVRLMGSRVEARTGVTENDDAGVILGFRWNDVRPGQSRGLVIGWDTQTETEAPLDHLGDLYLA
jgi:hypothetical protein